MSKQLFSEMALKAWHLTVKRTNEIFDDLSDKEIQKEIAPNKNRAIYILGHLVAVNDMMLPLLDLGESQFPRLLDIYLKNPDNPANNEFTIKELREFWNTSNATLSDAFTKLTEDQWFEKHTKVSDEDFTTAPHRNKLNVLMSRTSHLSYHQGQLILMKKK